MSLMNGRVALSIALAALIGSVAMQARVSAAQATRAASPPPRAGTAPGAAAAVAILNRSCTSCHEAGQITLPRPAADWQPIIERMRSNGASLSDGEAKILLDYLIRNHSSRP